MRVKIKKFDVAMEIKSKGVELDVYDTKDNFLGDFTVTKTGLIWCKGKVTRKNGVKISWDEFISWADNK